MAATVQRSIIMLVQATVAHTKVQNIQMEQLNNV